MKPCQTRIKPRKRAINKRRSEKVNLEENILLPEQRNRCEGKESLTRNGDIFIGEP